MLPLSISWFVIVSLFEVSFRDYDFHLIGVIIAFLDVVKCNFDIDFDIIAIGYFGGEDIHNVSSFFGLTLEVCCLLFEVCSVL